MRKKIVFLLVLVMVCLLTGCGNYHNQAEEIVKTMTLEEKIGQMLMPSLRMWEDENAIALNDELRGAIAEYNFGGIMLNIENCTNTENTVRLIDDMQHSSKYPALIGIEQAGGWDNTLNEGTYFGGNMVIAATGNDENAVSVARAIGGELKAIGVSVDFAPNGNIITNANNQLGKGKVFSDDEKMVSKYNVEFIHGLHSAQMASCMMDFPGIGDTNTDEKTGLKQLDKSYDDLKKLELQPYENGVRAKADMIMVSNVICPQIEKNVYTSELNGEIYIPASLSKCVINDILREDMKYKGIIVTDSLIESGIADNIDIVDAVELAINAGADIIYEPVDINSKGDIEQIDKLVNGITDRVKAGRIDENDIDESVTRIVEFKLAYNLMKKNGTASEHLNRGLEEKIEDAYMTVGKETNETLDLNICREAVTLVKDDNTLPATISSDDVISVFMPYSDDEEKVDRAIHYLMVDEKIPYDLKINYCIMDGSAVEDYQADIDEASCIIVISSLNSFANMDPESERGWQAAFVDRLIEKSHLSGKKITLISSGMPYEVARYQEADALIVAYCDKKETSNVVAAIYNILGCEEFRGKLPLNIYKLTNEYICGDEILYTRISE